LDSYKITDRERDDISKESLFYDVVSYKENDESEANSKTTKNPNESKYTPLTENLTEKDSDTDPKGKIKQTKSITMDPKVLKNKFFSVKVRLVLSNTYTMANSPRETVSLETTIFNKIGNLTAE
jgi:hypothetical protein